MDNCLVVLEAVLSIIVPLVPSTRMDTASPRLERLTSIGFERYKRPSNLNKIYTTWEESLYLHISVASIFICWWSYSTGWQTDGSNRGQMWFVHDSNRGIICVFQIYIWSRSQINEKPTYVTKVEDRGYFIENELFEIWKWSLCQKSFNTLYYLILICLPPSSAKRPINNCVSGPTNQWLIL